MALRVTEVAAVSRLLDEALALDADERSRWLDALPGEHAKLVPVLRTMLARADSTSGMLLDQLPRLRTREAEDAASALAAGQHVGPYQLIRELGVGGMAEVWLARRADGAYKREVALKLPKFTRLRQQLEQRFARERDILASLEHPNIARLYDAGVSADGLPFLAMECVLGQPLTTWCDANRLGLRERLKLFLQVTDAVQYAHARQVIHRDLKPSNILATESGQIRLLDFGVAKLLAEEEADRAPIHLYARALTPDYASPELLRGEPVDAASDVYSLGAVLYELLAGDRPYRLRAGASAAQWEQAIEGIRVEPPSARIAALAGVARATTQDRLAGRLRGDLDAIALKALAQHPADRYPSAIDLVLDLRRYLKGEPVQAVPGRMTNEQLVAQLSRNPKVRVRAPASTLQLKHKAGNTDSAAPAARSEEETVHRAGKTLRISAQLLRSEDGLDLWSQTYDLDLSDGFKLEHELTGTVARAVKEALQADAPRWENAGSSAHNLVLEGNFFRNRCTRVDTERAIDLYMQALALDPNYAVAWAMLALAHSTQVVQKWIPVLDGVNRTRQAVVRALTADASLACAHEALGVLNEKSYWNWPKAKAEFKRARELDPGSDRALVRLAAVAEAHCGRLDVAASVFSQVLTRNPLDTFALDALGWVQFAADRFDESIAAYRRLLTLNPSYHGANAALALALAAMGQHADALDAAERECDEGAKLSVLPIVLGACGRTIEADRALRRLEDDAAIAGAYRIAANHAYRGDVDAAFEWLDRACRERDPAIPSIKVDPLLRPLHGDPRFAALLVKLKLASPQAGVAPADCRLA